MSVQTNTSGDTTLRHIAVLGSSGGNLYSHGGSDPAKLIADVARQLDAAGFSFSSVQLVAAETSMDGVRETSSAQLWTLLGNDPQISLEGTLAEVNAEARRVDAELAERIDTGEIDGLILMSADPEDVNAKALEAAARTQIPVVGTGGTSIASAQQMGVNVISASGTTGTSSVTRAVAYAAGLAKHWKVKYRPALGSSSSSTSEGPAWKRISIRGIMVGSIPAFIALALVLAVSQIPALEQLGDVFDLLIASLPVVVAAVAARRISGLDEVGLVAGAVAGILSAEGGIFGGLTAGILSGLMASWLIKWTLGHRFPATTANIVTGAFAGLIPGLLVYYLLAPVTSMIGDGLREGIEAAVEFNPILAGALAGLVMWPAIIAGVYHSVILPLVLVEMSQKGHSFFGAIDMVSLVMVSLGITLANLIKPRTSGERALAGTGATINFGFGTFVEASYPFMFSDKKVFGVALISSAVGGAMVGLLGLEATAYLPAVVAPFVSTNAVGMVIAMSATVAIACTLTLLANLITMRKAPSEAA
ncbi:PTS transporter subunit EIIC [Nesterenkonia muleiensis]|uniref:PTS transporter subunit EIIC n=1 Tax=Nesterenkonia muleiensis TaxID=2282648 RepID=UPI000E73DB90|nr:PTS transporter subunit EIIC [Nesterenkonia muleiensis]